MSRSKHTLDWREALIQAATNKPYIPDLFESDMLPDPGRPNLDDFVADASDAIDYSGLDPLDYSLVDYYDKGYSPTETEEDIEGWQK